MSVTVWRILWKRVGKKRLNKDVNKLTTEDIEEDWKMETLISMTDRKYKQAIDDVKDL